MAVHPCAAETLCKAEFPITEFFLDATLPMGYCFKTLTLQA